MQCLNRTVVNYKGRAGNYAAGSGSLGCKVMGEKVIRGFGDINLRIGEVILIRNWFAFCAMLYTSNSFQICTCAYKLAHRIFCFFQWISSCPKNLL